MEINSVIEETERMPERTPAEWSRLLEEERTARAAAERRITELTTIIDSIPDAVYIGTERGITQTNRAGLEMLGFERVEDLSRTIVNLAEQLQTRYPETGERIPAEDQAFAHALNGRPITREVLVRHLKSGRDLLVRSAAAPIWHEHEIVGAVAINTDLTERRHAEEARWEAERRFSRLAAHAPVGIFQTDAKGGCVYVNEKWCELTGLSAEEAAGDGWACALHPDDRDRVLEQWCEAAQTGQEFASEYRFQKPDGEVRWVSAAAVAIKHRSGEIAGYLGTLTDITGRKRAERALLAHEEQLRLAIDTAGIGMSQWNILTGTVTWDEQLERIHGLAPGSFGGTHEAFLERVHPSDRAHVREALARSLAEGGSYRIEFRTIWPDAAVHWVLGKGRVFRGADGVPERMVAVGVDITERKLAQEAIETQAHVLESMAEGVVLAGEDGIISYTNPALDAMFGYEAGELAGRDISILNNYLPAERGWIVEDVNARLRSEGLWIGELENRRKDGSPLTTRARISVLELSGKRYHIAVQEDITTRKRDEEARRENEQQLRIALETAKLGSWQLDLSSGRLSCSSSCKGNFGIPLETDFTYRALQEAIHPDDRARVRAAVERALETRGVYEAEYRAIWPDGSTHWILASGRGIYDQDGQPFRMVGVTLEITHRKRAEEERALLLAREQQARKEAEAANRLKDEFLATLSHELRTPLTAVLGWTRMLRSSELDESMKARAIDIIERNAEAQQQLIEDLLDVSRIITGKLRLEMQPVELLPIVEAALDAVRPTAGVKGIQLQQHFSGGVDLVSGDPDRLQQVVWNLLSNAIKFTPKDGRVAVRVERLDSTVRIEVKDSGKGIAPDFLPHVFDRFRQADSTTTRSVSGLGLGLAVVRHLVEQHGGMVSAESEGEGYGATFIVDLPISPIAVGREEVERIQRESRINEQPEETVSLDGVGVVVVDDHPDARELLSILLQQYGAVVATASSADEAVEIVSRLRPDVLVSDIGMPGEDGFTLIRRIRALAEDQGGRVPAVALTAYVGDKHRERALREGFQQHISKPAQPGELALAVARLAGRAA